MMGALAAVGALSALLAVHFLLQRFGGSDALLLGWVSHGFLDLGDQGLLLGAGILLGTVGAAGLGPSNGGRNRGRRRVRPPVLSGPRSSLRRTQKCASAHPARLLSHLARPRRNALVWPFPVAQQA